MCLGGSTGINIAGAIRLARELGPGHTIVTILADYGTRYQSKLFNPEFLRSKNLPVPAWMDQRERDRRALREGRLMAFVTEALFREDGYLAEAEAEVVHVNERGGIILDRTIFYATSGGQPGDTGRLTLPTAARSTSPPPSPARPRTRSSTCRRRMPGLKPGERVRLAIDWERRLRLMRMHTACHLLTVVCPFPITGAAVAEDDCRVDFDIPDAGFTKEDVTARLMELVRGRPSGVDALDHRRGARRQSGPGEVEERAAADRHRADQAGADRRQRLGRQPALRRHACASRRPRSAKSISARSRRRAARTGAFASASGRRRRSDRDACWSIESGSTFRPDALSKMQERQVFGRVPCLRPDRSPSMRTGCKAGSARPASRSSMRPGTCRRRSATRAPNTRRRTFPARSSSTRTRWSIRTRSCRTRCPTP